MGLLQQYAGGSTSSGATGGNVEQDFDQVAQNTSQSHVAGGLTNAFRSGQSAPFEQMIGTLFSNSNGEQRAGILSKLLPSAGSGASSILGSLGAGGLGGLLGGGSTQVTPEQAQQVSPEAVQDLAKQAQQNNPSIVEEAGNFYAQHPTLVKSLGAGALALVMSHMSQNNG